jgi:hypothetical protein
VSESAITRSRSGAPSCGRILVYCCRTISPPEGIWSAIWRPSPGKLTQPRSCTVLPTTTATYHSHQVDEICSQDDAAENFAATIAAVISPWRSRWMCSSSAFFYRRDASLKMGFCEARLLLRAESNSIDFLSSSRTTILLRLEEPLHSEEM